MDNSNFKNNDSALFMKSRSMPLTLEKMCVKWSDFAESPAQVLIRMNMVWLLTLVLLRGIATTP